MRHLGTPIHLICLLLTAAGLPSATAQNVEQFTAWGDKASALGEHYGASRYYAEALGKAPGLMELQWKYAEACRLSNQYGEAALFYDKVQKKDHARKHPEALRWLAEMQMCGGEYKEAERTWAKARQRERKKDSFIAQRTDNGREGCRLAVIMQDAPDELVHVEHLPMPVNSFDSEFGARTGPDSALYFTTLRGKLNADDELQDTVGYHARIFRTQERGGRWHDPVALPGTVNNGRNNANGTWSTDGRWFYFSREEAPGEFSIRGIEHGNLSGTAVPILGEYGTSHTQPMVALVNGIQTLFFAKRNNGERTDMDLWSCTIDGDRAGIPVPLGENVNTPGNETCPYFESHTGTLWFSSDFLPGMGGYDIFTSLLGADGFAAPQNAGTPLNSSANDLYPSYDPRNATGWFTSNRAGSFAEKGETCCNDLYRFSYSKVPSVAEEADLDTAAVRFRQEKRLTSLREKLPIRLYFHNDEPDPRSWDTTTTLDYGQAFRSYAAKRADYDSAWQAPAADTTAFDRFFTGEAERNLHLLHDFTTLLLEAMREGQRITLLVRGYASPLARSDYNRNLSLRRIESLVHYLERTEQGALRPYLNGTATNGGRLRIERSPFGKSTADPSVSDRLDDLRNSVYSVGAAMERRIEIEQVEDEP